MTRPLVALQPAKNPVAQRNAARTLGHSIPLERIRESLSPSVYVALQAASPDGQVFVWGVREEREREFFKMMCGSPCLALFRGRDDTYMAGQVSGFTISTVLADQLWERDDPDEAWSHIYFLKNVRDIHLTTPEIHAAIARDREPASHWQALWTLRRRESERVIDLVRASLGKPPMFAAGAPLSPTH